MQFINIFSVILSSTGVWIDCQKPPEPECWISEVRRNGHVDWWSLLNQRLIGLVLAISTFWLRQSFVV